MDMEFIKNVDREYKGAHTRFVNIDVDNNILSIHTTLKAANKSSDTDKTYCIVLQGLHKKLGFQSIRPFYKPQ